jgi:hypothetical protein
MAVMPALRAGRALLPRNLFLLLGLSLASLIRIQPYAPAALYFPEAFYLLLWLSLASLTRIIV